MSLRRGGGGEKKRRGEGKIENGELSVIRNANTLRGSAHRKGAFNLWKFDYREA